MMVSAVIGAPVLGKLPSHSRAVPAAPATRRKRIGRASAHLTIRRASWTKRQRKRDGGKMPIEAVIWDFGGVLTSSPFEAFRRYEAENGLPADFIRSVNARNPDVNAWARFERSEIDAEAFDGLFEAEAAALGRPIPGREVLPLLRGVLRPRMVAALRRCKTRFKVGCITNNVVSEHIPGHTVGARSADLAAVFGLFDAVIESARAGVRKPDPRIYRMMCERLAVEPAACVYLDDLGINCKPAAQLGMRAIKVTDVDQALGELARATGISFEDEPA
jgi:putative hydrolase of the HAD superfamily